MKKYRYEPFLFTVFFLFSFWLMFHTFSYDGQTHTMQIGTKLWSDFGAHIPLIRSFSLGHNWPVEYPVYPGEPIRYHFIFDMIVGLLEKLGLRIDLALNIPSSLGFFVLLILLYTVAKKIFGSARVAVLTVVFFLFNGSLAFIRFFTLHPLSTKSPLDIIAARDFPAFAPWGPGDITAFWNLNIYTNQRHLALAFAFILFFILTVITQTKRMPLRARILRAIPWGIGIGILPYFHQPSLLIVAVFMLCYFFLYPKSRAFLFTVGALSLVLIAVQVFLSRTGTGEFALYPGYLLNGRLVAQHNPLQMAGTWVTYWWQNVGLHSLLILIGFFVIPKPAKKALFPIIPLFIIANLFKFSVEISANHKFFNFVLIMGQMISAYLLVSGFDRIKHGVRYILLIAFLILMTLSGIIDFAVVVNDRKIPIADIPVNETAAWIASNSPKNAVFLNSSFLYHPASIAGRPIFFGWPYFSWSAGYKTDRFPLMKIMYETRDKKIRCQMLRDNHISYVTVENVRGDPNLPAIDLSYFLDTYTPVFTATNGKYAIFTTEAICSVK